MDDTEFVRRAEQLIGPDACELMAYSAGLRGLLASHLAERPRKDRAGRHIRDGLGFDRTGRDDDLGRQADSVRAELRVAIELPPGVRHPVTEAEALDFMRAPRLVATRDYQELLTAVDRRFTDPRVLATVDYMLERASQKLGIPLYVCGLQLPPDREEAAAAVGDFVTGRTDRAPRRVAPGSGKVVQLAHMRERHLPWVVWDEIAAMMERAGKMTGYPVLHCWPIPGSFELDPHCRPFEGHDKRRPYRPTGEEARAESDALWKYYRGGDWEPPGSAEPFTVEVNEAGVAWVKPASYRELHPGERLSSARPVSTKKGARHE